MSLKKFTKIMPSELKSKGVVSLADKPNTSASYGVGGLSPTNLKLWFDQLSTLLAEKINAIYDALSGESAAEYMRLMLDGLDENNETQEYSLQDLCDAFINGLFASYLRVYDSASATQLKPLQTVLDERRQEYVELSSSVQSKANSAEATANRALANAGLAQQEAEIAKSYAQDALERVVQDSGGTIIYENGVAKAVFEVDFIAKAVAHAHNAFECDRARGYTKGGDIDKALKNVSAQLSVMSANYAGQATEAEKAAGYTSGGAIARKFKEIEKRLTDLEG